MLEPAAANDPVPWGPRPRHTSAAEFLGQTPLVTMFLCQLRSGHECRWMRQW